MYQLSLERMRYFCSQLDNPFCKIYLSDIRRGTLIIYLDGQIITEGNGLRL